jgi:two-component system sensor histidine kinase AlgZ
MPRGSDFLPDFCRPQSVFLVVLTAELLAIVLTLAGEARPTWTDLGFYSIFVQWTALLSSGLLCGLRRRVSDWPVWQVGVVAWLGILLATFAVALVSFWILNYGGDWRYFGRVSGEQVLDLGRYMGIAAIIGGVLLRYFYLQQQYRARIAAEARARIEALHARIHPHFLFNTLNTVAALVHEAPEQAEKAVEALADIMRAALGEAHVLVPWAEEKLLCERYLQLERWRLGDRLKVVWDDAGLQTRNTAVPALFLQPLLENAIVHGIARRPDGGELVISVGEESGQLEVRVRNPLADGEPQNTNGHGLGIDNIRQRLHWLFDGRAVLEAAPEGSDFLVRVRMPVRPWKKRAERR